MKPARFDMISVYTFYINRRELIQTSIIIYASFIPFLHTHTTTHSVTECAYRNSKKKMKKNTNVQKCNNKDKTTQKKMKLIGKSQHPLRSCRS